MKNKLEFSRNYNQDPLALPPSPKAKADKELSLPGEALSEVGSKGASSKLCSYVLRYAHCATQDVVRLAFSPELAEGSPRTGLNNKLELFDLKNKRVFLRADLNVPIKDGKILNDFKLRKTLKTIDYILNHSGKIILATHIGRPKEYDANLSTENLVNWFKNLNYKINFQPDLEKAKENIKSSEQILLLENLRFYPGEKNLDNIFAEKLASLADFYVNDAFAASHRNETSIFILPTKFPKNKRSIGFLFEQELNALDKIKNNPEQPFLVILGGAKIKDKINLLENLINKLNILLLLPAIVFSFLKAHGKNVGKSLVDDSVYDICNKIQNDAKNKMVKILFPLDYQVAKDNFWGHLSIIEQDNFKVDDIGISVGEKTVNLYDEQIKKAKTIFFNGLPGDIQRPETLVGAKKIFESIANSQAYSIIGGGDSVAAAIILGYENKFDYLSTAGGATLAYLSGRDLPGLHNL